MSLPPKKDPIRLCAHCNAMLTRKRFGKRLEDRTRFLLRKTCGTACMAALMMQDSPKRDAYRRRVRHLRRDACERCGAGEMLQVHHINRDWADNRPENLETLCATCHMKEHHDAEDVVARVKPKTCPTCRKVFTPKESRIRTCSRVCGRAARRDRRSQVL